MIVLGRFDIPYATSVMSMFNMSPREGHLKAVKRILAYLRTFPKGRIIVDKTYLSILLKVTLIGKTSILRLKKKSPMIFLYQRVQKFV